MPNPNPQTNEHGFAVGMVCEMKGKRGGAKVAAFADDGRLVADWNGLLSYRNADGTHSSGFSEFDLLLPPKVEKLVRLSDVERLGIGWTRDREDEDGFMRDLRALPTFDQEISS